MLTCTTMLLHSCLAHSQVLVRTVNCVGACRRSKGDINRRLTGDNHSRAASITGASQQLPCRGLFQFSSLAGLPCGRAQ